MKKIIALLALVPIIAMCGCTGLPGDPMDTVYTKGVVADGNIVDSDNLLLKSSKVEVSNLAAAGSLTLLDVSGAGIVTSINLILGTTAPLGSAPYNVLYSTLNFYINGELAPSSSPLLVDFFFSRAFPPNAGAGTSWHSDRIGISRYFQDATPATSIGYYRYVNIPFTDGIKITLENGDGGNDADVWAVITYQSGDIHSIGDFRVNNLYRTGLPNLGVICTPYEEIDLLNVASGSGRVESIFMAIYDGAGQPWAEGDIDMYLNGEAAPSYVSSGTEDFFMSCFGWAAGTYQTLNHGATVQGGGWMSFYRFFNDEPITFDDGIRIVWHNGELGQGAMINNNEMWACVTYYVDQ